MKQRISIIGAGNLATHISLNLQNAGHDIVQVYSRTVKSAKELAIKLKTNYVSTTNTITKETDLYIVAIKDSAIHEVLSEIDFKKKTIVHCSGSLPLSVLQNYSENIGVLYPLQTFSKSRTLQFQEIPVFVEANNPDTEKLVLELAKTISTKVSVLNSAKRKSLHISAVFANNFANHCYALAADFLQNQELPFDVLRPLIAETANKVQEMNPLDAQTGPAVRFDETIIKTHLEQLREFPEHQELYKSISKSIFDHHQEKNK